MSVEEVSMAKKRALTEIREELFALLAKVSTGITEPKVAKKRAKQIDREIRSMKPKRKRRGGDA